MGEFGWGSGCVFARPEGFGEVRLPAIKGNGAHHAIEPIRMGELTILVYIYQQTDAASLQDEIDMYWIQRGGGDPMEWCQKLDERLPLLHMKDCCFPTNNQPAFAGIGSGNLDRTRIIAAARKSGCQWFIIEQGTSPGDPF